MKRGFGNVLTFVLCVAFVALQAQKVKFTSSTDKKSYYDFEIIQLTYSIENASYKGVQMPSSPDFDVVDHSVNSMSHQSFFFGNGQSQSSSVEKYNVVFQLKSKKKGLVTIPEAILNYKGKVYKSLKLKVEVNGLSISKNESTKDRFIKVSVSNSNPKVGQSFTLSYTLFTVDQISEQAQIKTQGAFQNFGPFTAKTLSNYSASRAQLNGKVYTILELQKHVLTPVKGGSVTIPSFNFDYVSYIIHRQSFLRSTREEVEHKVTAPSVKINVKGLPTAPAGFSGLVGNFKFTLQVDKKSLPVNDAITVKYKVSGIGNFSALSEVNPKWSNSWEVLETNKKKNTTAGSSGESGSVTFEIVAIPRSNGKQEVPGMSLSYFNLKKNRYETMSVSSKEVEVTGVSEVSGGNFQTTNGSKSKVEVLGQDIKYLDLKPVLEGNDKSESLPLFLGVTLLGGIIGGVFIAFRYSPMSETGEQATQRRKKGAYKKAKKVLQLAENELNTDSSMFYTHLEFGLNEFLKDRLDISQKELTQNTVNERLSGLDVPVDKKQWMIDVYAKCAMAKYSPVGVDKKEIFEEVQELVVVLV